MHAMLESLEKGKWRGAGKLMGYYKETRTYYTRPVPNFIDRTTTLEITATGPTGGSDEDWDWSYAVRTKAAFGTEELMYRGRSYLSATKKVAEITMNDVCPNSDGLAIEFKE